MDIMLEKLKDYGADVDGAMGRFLDDIPLYKTCFLAFLNDEAFINLGIALIAKDYKNAFEYAHTLKGITGNMGLTPLYQLICSIVEALRSNEYSDLQASYVEVRKQLEVLTKIDSRLNS
ncbi:MAG: Hpt domain-containing protein [Oscillospiraceae bacterium]